NEGVAYVSQRIPVPQAAHPPRFYPTGRAGHDWPGHDNPFFGCRGEKPSPPWQRPLDLYPRRAVGPAAAWDELRPGLRCDRGFQGPRVRHVEIDEPVRRRVRPGRWAVGNLER